MNDVNKTTARHPGRSLLLLGVLFVVAGPALLFVLMFGVKLLTTPWYAPVLGTVGVALILVALKRSRSIWRWTVAVLFTLFVGAQWWALYAMCTPAYTGPVKGGQPFPTFASTLADGAAFTQDDLKGDQNTVMVFYRGHW